MNKYAYALMALSVAFPAWSSDNWALLNDKVVTLYHQQAYREAIPFAKSALELALMSRGEKDAITLTSMNNLAKLYQLTTQYEQAEAMFLETLALRQEVLGEHHQETRISQSNLISLYLDMHRFKPAVTLSTNRLETAIKYSKSIQTNLANMETLTRAYQAWIARLSAHAEQPTQEKVRTLQQELVQLRVSKKQAIDVEVAKLQSLQTKVQTLEAQLINRHMETKQDKGLNREIETLREAQQKEETAYMSIIEGLRQKMADMTSTQQTQLEKLTAQNNQIRSDFDALKSQKIADTSPIATQEAFPEAISQKQCYLAQEKMLTQITSCQEQRVLLQLKNEQLQSKLKSVTK